MNRRIVLTQDMAWDCLIIRVLEMDDFVKIVATADEGDVEISRRIPGPYNWRSVVEALLDPDPDKFTKVDRDEEFFSGGFRIEGAENPIEEDMLRMTQGGRIEDQFARAMLGFSDDFLLRLAEEEGGLCKAAHKTARIDEEAYESDAGELLLTHVLPLCPEALLVDLADQEGGVLKGWLSLWKFHDESLHGTGKTLKDVVKLYHSGNHEGIDFAYALIPEWEKETKERIARDEKAQKEAQKERLRLLEPWEARIDETILAAGYTSPETNAGYPGGGSLGSQMGRSARGTKYRAVRSFIEEYILVHGSLPTGTHEISFEFGFYYNGEKQHTVDVEFP